MARSENTGTVVHAWLRPEFAREIRELAARDGRSVSNLIKVALRDRLSAAPLEEDFAAVASAKAERPPGGLPHVRGAAPALGKEDG